MSRRIGLGARTRVASAPRGLWVEVDPGFFVGNDRRRFLGSISGAPTQGYTAFGPHSEFVGSFRDLDEAKAAVIAVVDDPRVDADAEAQTPSR